jgi:hypothetical protein
MKKTNWMLFTAVGGVLLAAPAFADIASKNYVDTGLSAKSNHQGAGSAGEVATVNSTGQYIRGGVALTDLALTTEVNTAITNAINNYDTTNTADLADKADKVSGATAGNLAGLDASGNLTDSGVEASDVASATAVANTFNNYSTTTEMNTAISNNNSTYVDNAINTEVTNRNTAITNAISTEVTNRNTAITNAITTEVTERNTAITNAITNNNTTIQGELDGKADLQGAGAVQVATVDATGQYVRSGTALGDLATDTELAGAISTEVTNRNTAITNAITTEVGDRNTAISSAITNNNANYYTKSETYTKTETDNAITAVNGDLTTLTGRVSTNETNITNLGTNKEDKANLKVLAYKDTINATALIDDGVITEGKLAAALVAKIPQPAGCADSSNYCVLTSNGTALAWEVIAR